MPAHCDTLAIMTDWDLADQRNENCALTMTCEVSIDGGQIWTFWGRFRSEGLVDGFVNNASPWMRVPSPPAGSLVRIRLQPTGSGMWLGAQVEGV